MTIDVTLPELGENIHGGDVVNVLVREGQTIEANQGIVELETDKAVIEVPSPTNGKVVKLLVKKGDTIQVGQTLATLDAAAPSAPAAAPASPAAATASPATAPDSPAAAPASATAPATAGEAPAASAGPIPAGPAVRRLAREMGVDLASLRGTGERGRITPEDVKAAAAAPSVPAAQQPLGAMTEPVVPPGDVGQDSWGPVRRDRMSQIRRTIAAQMSKSATLIPHVTNFDDADVTDLERLRAGVPPGFLGAPQKLTAMPFVLKAVAIALRRHPLLNASLDTDNGQIIYKQYVNLGVAVDTPRGLVVPVIRHVDRMSIPEIARALASVGQRARSAQFTLDELRGGTFTLSNLGAVGGTYSTPIINHPEVAVLLLGRSRWLPAIREEQIQPRLMMPLSLSYDHRLVDGAAAARFLNEVIDYLQSPGKLLLAQQ
jgi:pyruvate dehydrogenase E2 component (dihydrolipoamide acetyltransferase)